MNLHTRRPALWILMTALGLIALSGCYAAGGPAPQRPTSTPPVQPPAATAAGVGLANPADAYCSQQGYKVQTRTGADGSQSGVCIFPDGSECDAWAYFRKECQPGGKASAATAVPTAARPAAGAQAATPAAASKQAGQTVSIAEIGLSFQVPAGWQRQAGQNWVWTTGSEGQRAGLVWQNQQPGREDVTILPASSQMRGRSEGPAISWGSGATYRLQVLVPGGQGKVQAEETHVVIRANGRLHDFYASAPSEAGIKALEPALLELVKSVTAVK